MYHQLVRRVPLFSNLPDSEIDSLVSQLTEKTIPVRSILFREGERGNHFFIVVAGTIAIIKALDTPDEVVLDIRGPGDFVGEMSLFSRDGLRTASVRAESDLRVLEMTRQSFESLLSRQPAVVYEMLMVLSKRLNEANDLIVRGLIEKNEQLSQAYKELHVAQAQIIDQQIMDRELSQARDLQQSLLPVILPTIAGFDLGARMVPARIIGGDFFNVINLDEDRIGLAVGDVAGKGVPAALFMSLACSLLRSEALLHASPVEVLDLMNQHLRIMNPRGLFVTVLYGVLHIAKHEFVYARAGHEKPLIWLQDGEFITQTEDTGQPLGLFNKPAFDSQVVHLQPGSTLLLFTDGVIEAQNTRNDFFGEECLRQLVPDLLDLSAQDMCDQLVELLARFYGSDNRSDDVTLLALKTLRS
jgi:sigma-B regulation protein RsbU (phosphoserine phosphatase)